MQMYITNLIAYVRRLLKSKKVIIVKKAPTIENIERAAEIYEIAISKLYSVVDDIF